MVRKDGSHIDVEIDGKIGYNPDGSFKQTHCVLRDVTERKKAEEVLARGAEFERLISVVSSDFVGLDADETAAGIERALASIGAFTGADRAYVFLFKGDGARMDNTHEWCAEGIEPQIENLKNIPLGEELPWFAKRIRDREVFHVPHVAALPPEARLEREHFEAQDIQSLIVVPMVRADRLIGFLGFDAVRQRRSWTDDDQALLRLCGETFTNALERKQVEEELKTARRKAEAANIAKSQFLANMSHEIRTPMSVITGFADLLISEEDLDEQKSYVGLIQKAGKSLLRIIDEILDVSRIESGKLEIKIEDCSLSELLDGIEVMMRPLAREEGLLFDVFRCGKLPDTIQTDSGRVRQCLINLIGNAIKFTKRGHVRLKVSADDIQDKPVLRFDVEDTGIGIPQDKHVAVFETFSQADGSHTRQYGGTGLGLTIAKQLAQLLGGDLSFTTEVGKGSVFSLVIPASVDAGSSVLSGADEQTKESTTKSVITDNLHFSGKVLVVEDAESSQILAQKILERYGLEVVIVDNGTEAVEKTRQESFDLILMDIQMPGLNGLEATKKLREEGITTPIVALTAYAMPKDRANCMAAGCDDYISKPIDQDELRRVLSKYVAAETVSA